MVSAHRPVMLEVDLEAIRHNLKVVRSLAGPREVIASVKANAYGFGVVEVARDLVAAGVGKLWTGNVDEAIAMRRAGIAAEILLFGGYDASALPDILAHDLQPTIYDTVGLRAAGMAAAGASPAKVFVKVDAGLGRLGVAIDEARAFVRQVAQTPNIKLQGIYTHLPFGSVMGRDWASDRYQAFAALLEQLDSEGIQPPVTQVWGSAGVSAGRADRCNSVCVGHLLYGLTPLEPGVAPDRCFRPALGRLSAALIHKRLSPETGGAAGPYGKRNAGLAGTAAIGLGDGLRRPIAGQQAEALIQGRRVAITGFSLEHLMLDISCLERPALFDRVTLIGNDGDSGISLDDWARWTGSTPLEVMIGLSGKTPAIYLNRASDHPA